MMLLLALLNILPLLTQVQGMPVLKRQRLAD